MPNEMPYILCVDVGGPSKIGWADSVGGMGSGANLADALDQLASQLAEKRHVALGFEAPIWTPVRVELSRITSRRGGVETTFNRAWSAAPGACVLGAALALMPWCLKRISGAAGAVPTTVSLDRFREHGGLFLWEAFVSGKMKGAGATHHDDAQLACKAFASRWPHLVSDIPAELAFNHAVSSALAAGLAIDLRELTIPAIVVAASPRTVLEPTAA